MLSNCIKIGMWWMVNHSPDMSGELYTGFYLVLPKVEQNSRIKGITGTKQWTGNFSAFLTTVFLKRTFNNIWSLLLLSWTLSMSSQGTTLETIVEIILLILVHDQIPHTFSVINILIFNLKFIEQNISH